MEIIKLKKDWHLIEELDSGGFGRYTQQKLMVK
jgi:hypothetical protein